MFPGMKWQLAHHFSLQVKMSLYTWGEGRSTAEGERMAVSVQTLEVRLPTPPKPYVLSDNCQCRSTKRLCRSLSTFKDLGKTWVNLSLHVQNPKLYSSCILTGCAQPHAVDIAELQRLSSLCWTDCWTDCPGCFLVCVCLSDLYALRFCVLHVQSLQKVISEEQT